ncbi:uncharacterized protein LOC130361327 isoform X2 [Hyla sarda]|uniref:uncharacterized protein LOC130361327 isoform X2 n=1 Tax=Hyla sarda TaxID=327740 RepID=UPI0024C398C4|nr:uncharacterized protein LOC130361327 isoform X2 [Hyla sarda]
MGSGSSKSKRRVISQQPLHPTEIPKGESTTQEKVVYEQKERDQEKTPKATQPALETKGSRRPPNDPDLQLLDDMLTESEDCLSWQDPILKGQKMTNSSRFESLSPGQENPRPDKEVPRLLRITPDVHPASSESEKTQNIDDIYKKTVPGTRCIFDIENNNLSKYVWRII